MTKHSWLYQQLFNDWKSFEIFYVCGLILLQIIAFIIVPDTPIGMICGISGVIGLVYGMKGRKISFIFGFIQCIIMTYIAWISQAYGQFIIGIIYVISQPIGWYLWGNDDAVNSFSKNKRNIIFIGAIIAWLVTWLILVKIGGQLPYLDSVNLVIALIAQALYIFKYKENWSLWIIVNIVNTLYWCLLTYQIFTGTTTGTLGATLSQVALQIALLFNSIYASKVWNQQTQ